MADKNSSSDDRFEEVTVRVRKDMPDALREQLIRQLERPADHTVVGNFADLQRMGAAEVAGGKSKAEVFHVNPAVDHPKEGAKRALEEEADAQAATEETLAGARVGEGGGSHNSDEPNLSGDDGSKKSSKK